MAQSRRYVFSGGLREKEMKRISLTTILYLPLGYLLVSQLDNYFELSGYYYPVSFQSFALIVILIVGFAALVGTDLFKKYENQFSVVRTLVVFSTIIFLLGTAVFSQITIRHLSGYFGLAHDGAQQTEVASDFLLHGKNPYHENYKNTPFGEYNAYKHVPGKDNPAWHYYIYLPLYLSVSAGAQWLSQLAFGWYDQRYILVIAFALALWVLYRLPTNKEDKLLAVLLFALNPFFTQFFIVGYNDIFVFALMVLSLFLLHKKSVLWSAVIFGLAMASKQTAWLFLPLYGAYLYARHTNAANAVGQRLKTLMQIGWPAIVVPILIALPFIVWSPADFYADTVGYAGGSAVYNYPISGIGLSQVLLQAGIIHDSYDSYPFWVFQLLVSVPLLYFLGRTMQRNASVVLIVIGCGLLLLAFWFVSRFFNANYLSFISLLLIAAWAFERSVDDAKSNT